MSELNSKEQEFGENKTFDITEVSPLRGSS